MHINAKVQIVRVSFIHSLEDRALPLGTNIIARYSCSADIRLLFFLEIVVNFLFQH